MVRKVGYEWRLRQVMNAHGMHQTTDLAPLLAERGITLSAAQVYRLVTSAPERLSMPVLAALCDIFDCESNELITTHVIESKQSVASGDDIGSSSRREMRRPRRAEVDPNRT